MKRAIDLIYNLRQKFIIGLTGRTGSGATTAADILSSSSLDFEKIFKDVTLPKIDQLELGILHD